MVEIINFEEHNGRLVEAQERLVMASEKKVEVNAEILQIWRNKDSWGPVKSEKRKLMEPMVADLGLDIDRIEGIQLEVEDH